MAKVSMDIPPARTGLFAQIFQDEGLDVSWDAPMEKRSGVGDALVHVVYFLEQNSAAGVIGGTAYAAVQSAVKRIRERFPTVEITIEDDDSIEDPQT